MTPDFQNQQPPAESGFCPQCGEANARTAAFCAKCGAPLPWAAPKAEPVAPQAAIPVAPQAAIPVAPAPRASVPPPMPPPTVLPAPPMPAQAASSATASGVPVLNGLKRLGAQLFPPELLTAYKGATPQELLWLYGLRVVGLVLLLVLIKSYAYSIVSVLAMGMMVCLVVGLKNPDSFRWIFGDKTSKATVGWTLAGLLFMLGLIRSSMDPKKENSERVFARKPVEKAQPIQNMPAQVPTRKTDRVGSLAKAPAPDVNPTAAPVLTSVPPAKPVPLNMPRNDEVGFPELYRNDPGAAETSSSKNLQGRVKQVSVMNTEGGPARLRLAHMFLFKPDGKIERDVRFTKASKSDEIADPVISSVNDYKYNDRSQLFREEEYDGDPQDGGKKTSETTYEYESNRLKKKTYLTDGSGFTQTHTLGSFGPTSITDVGLSNGHTTTTQLIYQNGLIVKRIDPDAPDEDTYVYADGFLMEWGSPKSMSFSFDYWDNGYVKKEVRKFKKTKDGTGLSQFVTTSNRRGQTESEESFDAQGQLDHRWAYSYLYDTKGNWIKKVNTESPAYFTVRDITYY